MTTLFLFSYMIYNVDSKSQWKTFKCISVKFATSIRNILQTVVRAHCQCAVCTTCLLAGATEAYKIGKCSLQILSCTQFCAYYNIKNHNIKNYTVNGRTLKQSSL